MEAKDVHSTEGKDVTSPKPTNGGSGDNIPENEASEISENGVLPRPTQEIKTVNADVGQHIPDAESSLAVEEIAHQCSPDSDNGEPLNAEQAAANQSDHGHSEIEQSESKTIPTNDSENGASEITATNLGHSNDSPDPTEPDGTQSAGEAADPENPQTTTNGDNSDNANGNNHDQNGDSNNVPLRHRAHDAVRNHLSVISCPEVAHIVRDDSSERNNRRHSMDVFDAGTRLKRKKGHFKRTDISGPICTAGNGPSATIKTRPIGPIRSVNSESNLLEAVRPSSLSVNMTEYSLNSPDQPPLIISWDINCSISSLDCISLYLRKQDAVPELVSFRNAGVGYMPKGEITWDLNQHQEKFNAGKNFVVFKYYHPTSTGGLSLVAASEQLIVYNRSGAASRSESMRSIVGTSLNNSNSEISVLILSGICGYNLKRGVFFNPDPYVKISVFPGPGCAKHPHHKQMYRTKQAGNTINPVWKEQFMVQALPSDLVELEVKDRFERSRPILRRFLGRLLIPAQKLQDLIELGEERYTEALGKRNPIDQTSGSLSFLVTTAARHPSFMRASAGVSAISSSRNSTPRASTSSQQPTHQSSTEEENYSSDASSGNSEHAEQITSEYGSNTSSNLPNGSAVIEAPPLENSAPSGEETVPKVTDQTEVEESMANGLQSSAPTSPSEESIQPISVPESLTEPTSTAESTDITEASSASENRTATPSPKAVKELPKNQAISSLKIEASPESPSSSPKDLIRSPMRKSRLGAVSFFPSETTNSPETPAPKPVELGGPKEERVPSLRNISLSVVSKTAEKSEMSSTAAGASNRAVVPSLMRLTSLELQRYGAVGGATSSSQSSVDVHAMESPAPSKATKLNKPTASESLEVAPAPPTKLRKKVEPESVTDGPMVQPSAAKEPAKPKLPSVVIDESAATASTESSSPVSEFLSITIHRASETPLGLSIVGGSKQSKPRAKQIRVTKVEPGSPAEEAGVKVGDRILAVNTKSMVNVNHDFAVSIIRNSGTEVVMQVERRLTASTKRRYSKNNSLQLTSVAEGTSSTPRTSLGSSGRQSTSPGPAPVKLPAPAGSVKLPSAFDARFRASRHRIMSRTDITPENEIPSQEGLPPNWEAFKDRHGRIYYVDHENRTTQWNHPTLSPTPSGEPARGGASSAWANAGLAPGAPSLRRRNSTEGDRNYESAMKRYQSIKRAMKRQSRVIGESPEEEAETMRFEGTENATRGIHSPTMADDDDEESRSTVSGATGASEISTSASNATSVDSAITEDEVDSGAPVTESEVAPKKDNALLSPGCRFLTHPGFRDALAHNSDANSLYQSSSVLRYIVTKVTRDVGNFLQYQHNKELVKFINMFSDPTQDLPRGWETRNDPTAKPFFIDHNLKLTTFMDPRLPLINTPAAPVPEVETEADKNNTTAENEMRGPVQSPVLSEQPPPIPPRPERTLTEQSRRVETTTTAPNTTTSESTPQEDMPTAYNEKVVAFLMQPNIIEILKERHPEVGTSESLKERIMVIRTEGVSALERLSYSVNLTLMLSKFEDEIMNFVPKTSRSVFSETTARNRNSTPQGSPVTTTNDITKAITRSRAPAPYRRDFESKLHNFYKKLDSKGYGKGPNKIKMQVRRDHLLEDAFQKVKTLSRKELQRSKLNISFVGEEGLDYSGPSREFFFLVSRELFNPYYGLFEYSAVDTYTVQISPMSAYIDDPMDWFRFAGRIIGLALIHHYLLDAFFTRPLYKALLRAKCDISDLQYIDEQFFNSLMWMKDNDITDVLDLNFTADEEVFGQVVEKELKPNGKNIVVTEKNKKEYIERIVKWRVNRSCREQTNQVVRGFNEVIDLRLVSVFDARELELVLCGTAEIDLNDWRQNTEYRGGYHDLHQVIQWFWEALEKFDNERRLRLLQFVTGTSSIPYEGFSALRGPNGPKRFCIEKWGKVHFLPRAHTCFNRIDLPPYPSFQVLWEKMTIAVEETSTFGIE